MKANFTILAGHGGEELQTELLKHNKLSCNGKVERKLFPDGEVFQKISPEEIHDGNIIITADFSTASGILATRDLAYACWSMEQIQLLCLVIQKN